MALKNRVIEIIYRLVDDFTGRIGKITGGYKQIEKASSDATSTIQSNSGRSEKSLLQMGKTFAAAFVRVQSIRSIIQDFREATKEIDRMAKTSAKLGLTTEALSELEFVAQRSNIATQQLSTGLQRMTRRVAEAAKGTGEAKSAIAELNLDAVKLAELSPDKIFLQIAEAMSKIPDQADRVRLGFKLFDTEGVDLINTMNEGAAGIRRLMRRAQELGKTIGSEGAKEIEEFNNRLLDMNTYLDSIGNRSSVVAIREINRLLRLFDEDAASKLHGVSDEIAGIDERLQRIASRGDGFVGAFERRLLDASSAYLEKRKADLESQRESLINDDTNAALSNSARDRNAILALKDAELKQQDKQTGKDRLAQLKDDLRAQEEAYRESVAKIKALAKERKDINEEFKDLKRELSAEDKPEEAASLRAVQDLRASANQQLAAGEFDDALKSISKASELLRVMKEEGTESNLVLTGTAEILRQLAEEATSEKEKASLVNAEKTKTEVADIKKSIDELKAALDGSPASLRAVLDTSDLERQASAIRAKISSEPIVIRVIGASGEPSFTDGKEISDFGSIVSSEAAKRGAAL